MKDDATLFELLCIFRLMKILRSLGWASATIHIVDGAFSVRWQRQGNVLDLFYQHTPRELREASIYARVLRAHDLRVGGLTPDFVLRLQMQAGDIRWVLGEVKGGQEPVSELARRALQDLLTYRRAFDANLCGATHAYGIGIAWGEGLQIADSTEVYLCTPDTLSDALRAVL